MRGRKEHLNSSEFRDFILKEFEAVTNCATLEEMADFAFGGIKYALDKFKQRDC